MLILALDTTTRGGSCAIARGRVVLREEGSDPSQPPAARLPADLMALLAREGVSLDAVEAFAVAIGPGSFTGLRIGIATMQGLAFAAGRPLLGISGFDALADIARKPRVGALVDAWRGEVYAALYEDGRPRAEPIVAAPDAVLAGWGHAPITFVGDGADTYRDLIRTRLGPNAQFAEPIAPLLAGGIARLAAAAIERGEGPPPQAIRPLYVRRADAELARDRA